MKSDRSFWLMILYFLFTFLYTLYIISHHPAENSLHRSGHAINSWAYKRDNWAYYLKFLLISGYLFFILQGLALRSKSWGILLLLPLALLAATILAGFLIVWILRLGGGTLLDRDDTDMVLTTGLLLIGTYFSLRLIRPGGRRINRAGKKR